MKVTTSQERIRSLLDNDPRSDSSIGKQLGVSKQAVSAWRTGDRSPKKNTMLKISRFYNVSIDWLMGFDVEKEHTRKAPNTDIYVKLILGMTPEDYDTVMRIFEKTEIRMREEGKL